MAALSVVGRRFVIVPNAAKGTRALYFYWCWDLAAASAAASARFAGVYQHGACDDARRRCRRRFFFSLRATPQLFSFITRINGDLFSLSSSSSHRTHCFPILFLFLLIFPFVFSIFFFIYYHYYYFLFFFFFCGFRVHDIRFVY